MLRWVALLFYGVGSVGQEGRGLSFLLGYKWGESQCWLGGASAQPWGSTMSLSEAGEGYRWAAGGAALTLCVSRARVPRSLHIQQFQARARGCWHGNKRRVKGQHLSPTSSAALLFLSVLLLGDRCLVTALELLIAANTFGAIKPSPFLGGDSCHLK